MEIEKNISFFVEQQFPAIYKENGPELVELTRYYYKFLEDQTNQSLHVARRFFDYKDVDTTVQSLLIFFHKKFLADLPLDENIVPFLTKNILDLYRRKGTPAGIETFFSIFYNEYEIDITYPASKMLKVSNSKWRRGVYLQMFPNNNQFDSPTGDEYTYADLISRNIRGSVSGAKAAVSRINFILIDNTRTPIIYIDEVKGNFTRYDELITSIDGELIKFGRVNGSLTDVTIDEGAPRTSGNRIGDILNVRSEKGTGGKVIVSEVTDTISGEIVYELVDGGYGYTVDNTRLLVSTQTLLLNNSNLDFVEYETLRDSGGNEGIVLGQTIGAVGVYSEAGNSFDLSRNIFAVDRDPLNPLPVELITPYNASSPGTQYADDTEPTSVIADITDTTNIEAITDVINPFLSTTLNAADYEAAAPMSGSASPVTINTPLDEAFDIQTLTIGRIERIRNILPGADYQTQVFAKVKDDVISAFGRHSQVLALAIPEDARLFVKGERITEAATGLEAEITAIDTLSGSLSIIPFDYDGFTGSNNIIKANGDQFALGGISIDYDSNVLGDNAIMDADIDFAIGQIDAVNVVDSGFGYVENTIGYLEDDDGNVKAQGLITQNTQGFTQGYWADFSSHLNGYQQEQIQADTPLLPTRTFALTGLELVVGNPTTPPEFTTWGNSLASDGFAYLDITKNGSVSAFDMSWFLAIAQGTPAGSGPDDVPQAYYDRWNDIIAPSLRQQAWFEFNPQLYEYVLEYDYFNSGMRIQDSDFYQEYSYLIKSTLPLDMYEKRLKDNVHLAGTKLFGDFVYKVEVLGGTKPRFLRLFNDDGRGSPLDTANVDLLEASVTNFTVDSTIVSADHEPV